MPATNVSLTQCNNILKVHLYIITYLFGSIWFTSFMQAHQYCSIRRMVCVCMSVYWIKCGRWNCLIKNTLFAHLKKMASVRLAQYCNPLRSPDGWIKFPRWLCVKLGNGFENVTRTRIVHAQRQKFEFCLYRICIQMDVCISLNYRLPR